MVMEEAGLVLGMTRSQNFFQGNFASDGKTDRTSDV